MRVFKDLDLVEQLGSGIPRILQYYDRECFAFRDSFTRMTFPVNKEITQQDKKLIVNTKNINTPQVTPQVKKLLEVINGEMLRVELQDKLGLKDRGYFRKEYLLVALEKGLIELTIPDKPNSSNQKYRLTDLGQEIKNKLSK